MERIENNCIIDGTTVIGVKDVYQKDLIIPNGITKINDEAFLEYYGLENVSLPKSLTEIGDRAFFKCTSLKRISFPEKVMSLGEWVLAYCDSLLYVELLHTEIEEIPTCMFFGCKQLASVFLPETVMRIRKHSFAGCGNLRYINLPKRLKIIESFPPLKKMSSLYLSDNLVYMEDIHREPISVLRVFASPKVYLKFEGLIPHMSEIVLDQRYSYYDTEITAVLLEYIIKEEERCLAEMMEARSSYNSEAKNPHSNEAFDVAQLYSEMFSCTVGLPPKTEITSISFCEVNEKENYLINITFKADGEGVVFGRVTKTLCGVMKQFGRVDPEKWKSFCINRTGLMINNGYVDVNKRKSWKIKIEFKDKSHIRYQSSSFDNEAYLVVNENLGEYIYADVAGCSEKDI